MEINVKVGDTAPNFYGPTSDGSKLTDFRGRKNVVLYFYPKDDTPGCTKEACSFRDNLKAIREMGSEIVGISVDDVDSHKKFAEKYHLPFPLVSDPDKKIATAYGVLRDPPTMTNRVTFIIDKNGKIANIFPKVDVTQHTEEVVAALKKLG
ncbi:MAG TPA: peroxiredoxin [Candidatus Bathyarchaeia archaeon]|jgi:peroxiredoxin Q/BCP|nr:peroxiredoxin [Candidatus Bathyarchaeia archaeon]